mgnify:CR=1 FL=1
MKKYFKYLLLGLLLFSGCGKYNYDDDNYDAMAYSGGKYNNDGYEDFSGEQYNEYTENPFLSTADYPVSTFSVDVDGASYSNLRRYIGYNQLPPDAAIRIEELINYFYYDYNEPTTGDPISVEGEICICPWNTGHKLIRIGVKGMHIEKTELPPANFVFLIDVSGSMSGSDKLELLKGSFTKFVNGLNENDRVAIVTYAGSSGVKLPSTNCSASNKTEIVSAINSLGAGGSTAGAEGINTAYDIAVQNFIPGGNNRVILGTDGDFNVGISSQEELVALIEQKREEGIFLTVLGVGTGNLNEGMMEQLANNGNGNYEYIDNQEQGDKVFIYDYNSFYTVAKDVKVQVEFTRTNVKEYRLIGYENRMLEEDDFQDDEKDAGEIGSDQTVTALYEIIPKQDVNLKVAPTFIIRFRYKNPDEDVSNLIEMPVYDNLQSFDNASESMRFSAAVAGFGMLLIDSQYKGDITFDKVVNWTSAAKTYDPYSLKSEFVNLVQSAKSLK